MHFQMLIIRFVIFDTDLIRRKDRIRNFPAPFYFPEAYRRQSFKIASTRIIRCIRADPDENSWFYFSVLLWFETHATHGVVNRMSIKRIVLTEVRKSNWRLMHTPGTRSFFAISRHFSPCHLHVKTTFLFKRTCSNFPKSFEMHRHIHAPVLWARCEILPILKTSPWISWYWERRSNYEKKIIQHIDITLAYNTI